MSAGPFTTNSIYEDNFGNFYPIKVQPETLGLTLNSKANVSAAGPLPDNRPSVSVSNGRRANGVNARLVRFRFTGTLPPGYLMSGTISLPVLTPASYASYSKGTVGTYTLNAVEYPVATVGRTPETIN